MTDAAAFFANKKKKKKAFKFNANKIDSSTVTNTVHVNAPAISTTKTDVSATTGVLSSLTIGNGSSSFADPALATTNEGDDGAQWDDAALAAKTSRKVMAVSVPSGVTTKELAETKAMALKTYTSGNEQEDIVEKLRVEETKAKLAAAREGMEREAQRIKEGKEKKEQEVTSSRFGNAAAGMSASSGVGGKWVPSRMRAGGGGIPTGWGSKMSSQKKVDTEDEDLFPDLATADAIIEKQKQEQPAFKAPTKTPVGGGASWGASSSSAAPATRPKLNLAPATRPKLNLKKKTQQEPSKVEEGSDTGKAEETPTASSAAEKVKSEAVSPLPTTEEPTLAASEVDPSPAVVAAAIAPAPIKPKKKKKKKDISTFKK